MRKTRILVLCYGNMYRSPLAAAIMSKCKRLEIKSAGLRARGGLVAKPIREHAVKLGFNLNEQRSVPLSVTLHDWADLIVVMSPRQGELLREFEYRNPTVRNRGKRAVILGHFANPARNSIPDPAFLKVGSDRFKEVLGIIEQASKLFVEVMTA